MNLTYLSYILLISFVATLVRSTLGFGESLIAVPLLILFLPIDVAVPLSVLLSVVIALVVVVQDHQKIHFNSAKWLILFAAPGIPIGLFLLVYGNQYWVKGGLGVLIVLYCLYALLTKGHLYLKSDSKLWLFVCGFLSGVLGGAYGLNGPPLVIYGNMRKWEPRHFRATLQAYFLPASLFGLIGYGAKGLLNAQVFVYFLAALPVVIPTVWLGRYLNKKLKDDAFFRYVYSGLIIIGLFLISHAITDSR